MIVIQVRGMICYARGEMYTAAEVNTIMCRRNRDGTVVTIEHKRTQMLTKKYPPPLRHKTNGILLKGWQLKSSIKGFCRILRGEILPWA